ncbi:leucine-rich repeat domain-containing protein [Verminephrobacter aporrectodeae]|uniref:hypothetical protein n=1 Tax=Verminephrobacter aporrectodeae TaxID=1110389 RepID=UPI002238521A|nr:hypothetical protein [Verminephrobacter aporrectodeae]
MIKLFFNPGSESWDFDGEDVEEAIRIVANSNVRALSLILPCDSKHENLNFLLDFPELSEFQFDSHSSMIIDTTAIGKMSTLKRLVFFSYGATGFEIDHLQALEELIIEFDKTVFLPKIPMPRIELIDVARPNGVDLDFLKNFPSVRNVTISRTRRLESIQGIEACRNITYLWIDRCPNLLDIKLLPALDKLDTLHLSNLKNLSSIEPVFEVDSLSSIIIEKNHPIKEIKNVSRLKNLESLNISRSEIIDGDISCILDAPKLTECNIRPNKPHYQPTASYVHKVIKDRDQVYTELKRQMTLRYKQIARKK